VTPEPFQKFELLELGRDVRVKEDTFDSSVEAHSFRASFSTIASMFTPGTISPQSATTLVRPSRLRDAEQLRHSSAQSQCAEPLRGLSHGFAPDRVDVAGGVHMSARSLQRLPIRCGERCDRDRHGCRRSGTILAAFDQAAADDSAAGESGISHAWWPSRLSSPAVAFRLSTLFRLTAIYARRSGWQRPNGTIINSHGPRNELS
jgi:hypothetical protein